MSESDQPPGGTETEATVDVSLIDEMLRMSPSERLRQNDRMAALTAKLRALTKVNARYRGRTLRVRSYRIALRWPPRGTR
jgi:hypothetical protein